MLDGISMATASTLRLHVKPVSSAGSTTIQQVLSSTICPNKFTVVARAVDFFPFLLEDACILRCTKCKVDVHPLLQGCPMCDDMMGTHCKWFYCLYIRLKDNKDKDITLSLCGKECSFLQDVEPADFRYDAAAFDRFLAKLTPVLGNLREVHEAWSKNEEKDIDSPLMRFTFESWNVGDGRGYGLLGYASL
ncbi:hypothetical protein F5I97DRAFT_558528 [Phlebopus sp. FC_14]|nr:hypothetical protein F5I97DRAFT_558528 [Phlebopus sp. FC_14]